MSLENEVKRVADALEKLATFQLDKVGPVIRAAFGGEADTTTEAPATPAKAEPSASGGPKAVRKNKAKDEKPKADPKPSKKEDATEPAPKKDATEPAPKVTRETVQAALVEFCTKGPGKERAKLVLEEFKAGSISTLGTDDYGPFIGRLRAIVKEGS